MRPIVCSLALALILGSVLSCEKDEKNPTLDDFCHVKPVGWECEIIEHDFNINDIPRAAEVPIAIIRYKNPGIEFTSHADSSVNPTLVLNFYPISKRHEVIDLVRSQQIFSWCIPLYYGETKDFLIITSPCFINGGTFTDEANASIAGLHSALKKIIEIRADEDLGK